MHMYVFANVSMAWSVIILAYTSLCQRRLYCAAPRNIPPTFLHSVVAIYFLGAVYPNTRSLYFYFIFRLLLWSYLVIEIEFLEKYLSILVVVVYQCIVGCVCCLWMRKLAGKSTAVSGPMTTSNDGATHGYQWCLPSRTESWEVRKLNLNCKSE